MDPQNEIRQKTCATHGPNNSKTKQKLFRRWTQKAKAQKTNSGYGSQKSNKKYNNKCAGDYPQEPTNLKPKICIKP